MNTILRWFYSLCRAWSMVDAYLANQRGAYLLATDYYCEALEYDRLLTQLTMEKTYG